MNAGKNALTVIPKMDDALLDYTEVIWERYNFLFDSEVILQQGQNQIDELSQRGAMQFPAGISIDLLVWLSCCVSYMNNNTISG